MAQNDAHSVANPRLTVARLEREWGARASSDAQNVTFTSLPTALDEVSPGSLFVPSVRERTMDVLRRAVLRGAYGIALPADARDGIPRGESQEGTHGFPQEQDPHRPFSARGGSGPTRLTREVPSDGTLGIPVLFADDLEHKLGPIAAYLESDPSQSIAMFVVFGPGSHAICDNLAALLHMLGNPVGTLVAGGSRSVTRALDLDFPLDAVHLQHELAVMSEDGATAAVVAADDATLDPYALCGCSIDVVYGEEYVSELHGAVFGKQTHRALSAVPQVDFVLQGGEPSQAQEEESGTASGTARLEGIDDAQRVALAMALAAGITTDAIRQASRVFDELK